MTKQRLKVVTIGGGTGHFALLSGLKGHDVDITAIVTMADSGGSTGRLRDELGVLPPGDVRQCLVALSDADETMRQVFAHRFDAGTLKGHTLGNVFLSGLEQVTGSFDEAVERVGDLLKIRGRVLPVSHDAMHLRMTLNNGKVLEGEDAIDTYQHISRFGVASIELASVARINPAARAALKEADLIVVGPGDLYTSIMPNLLVKGVAHALQRTSARRVFVANLMNKYGQTDGLTVCEYLDECRRFVSGQLFDTVLYNTTKPATQLLAKYLDEGEPVHFRSENCPEGVEIVGADILAAQAAGRVRGDSVARSFIRHDPDKLARALLGLVSSTMHRYAGKRTT